MATEHCVMSVDDARWWVGAAQRIAALDCGSRGCRHCRLLHARAEDAALAYDLAVSIGRRWSAPSWLEPVAW